MRLSELGDIKQRSKIDLARATGWLNQNWKGTQKCPICTNTKWNVSDELVVVTFYTGRALSIGGQQELLPFMMVTCDTCGHTLLFDAIKAGLVQGQR